MVAGIFIENIAMQANAHAHAYKINDENLSRFNAISPFSHERMFLFSTTFWSDSNHNGKVLCIICDFSVIVFFSFSNLIHVCTYLCVACAFILRFGNFIASFYSGFLVWKWDNIRNRYAHNATTPFKCHFKAYCNLRKKIHRKRRKKHTHTSDDDEKFWLVNSIYSESYVFLNTDEVRLCHTLFCLCFCWRTLNKLFLIINLCIHIFINISIALFVHPLVPFILISPCFTVHRPCLYLLLLFAIASNYQSQNGISVLHVTHTYTQTHSHFENAIIRFILFYSTK